MALPFRDPVLIFATVMVLILLAPLLARRLRLPGIVGLLLAGILVGPHGVGILARDQTIDLLGTVGLLYIMFLAGLEIDLNEVRRNKLHTLVFGLLTFVVPLAMGTALGMMVFAMTIPVAVLLASMFSSHTLVTFPMVAKLGLAKSRPVTTAIGGTIITDTLALLILAVIASMSRGQISAAFWIRLFAFMLAYVAAVLVLVPMLGRWFFRRLSTDENVEFVFVLALAFLAAYLAHLAGLEPIIGAFLAGITLNSLIPEKSLLMARVRFTGEAIFIPFFLLSVGMLVDLRLLVSGVEAWLIAAGMIGVALAAKLAAAWISGKVLRYRRSEWKLLYGLSVNQAAATLAAALIGYNLGLFNEAVITGTILMIAVTCFVGPLITERAGRRVALEEEQAAFDASMAPHRILIPLSEREGAKELLDLALLLRQKHSHEPLYPLRVAQDGPDAEQQVARSEKILAHSVVRAMAAGAPVTPVTNVDVNVTSGILRAARENRISLLVLGWNGVVSAKTRTFGRHIDAVIERSTQMVLVNRVCQPVNTAKRIVAVLPPFAEREIGFEEVIPTVKALGGQAGTSLMILCTAETLLASRDFIEKTRPKVKLEFRTVASLKTVMSAAREVIGAADWVLLMAARKGEMAWQPLLDRLPGRLAREFPNNNLTVVISPVERWDPRQASERRVDGSYIHSVFRKEHTLLQIGPRGTAEVLRALLSTHFRAEEAGAVTLLLAAISREEPVELVADVALLHTHVPNVQDSVVFLGVSQSPLDIPLASGPPHSVVILLAPVGQDPAMHLQALADIARILRLPDMVSVLRAARSFEDILRAIARKSMDS
ncbi:MAG: cation:proton antiporter [Spirochaetales bacterium]|nr:cation:proton antiporter [Spirochaetales bacterium]